MFLVSEIFLMDFQSSFSVQLANPERAANPERYAPDLSSVEVSEVLGIKAFRFRVLEIRGLGLKL